ncbi:branched-chain amino acid transport system carrier protein [Lactobacillus nasalidis]|uniref:Branched-chain amino acid transport system carrier protein n=1 Tax=Lactobacillus nasalidis TaxID=2797258 RepID=A0ABQ3W5E7_9LACO|nr:branched-chain amino acid transport system II carrier protein [Lactobacillus nasalidis]GHV97613.1 branched-chain amino acid transport system carrier protein [Lactobacillus nasalidis]GHW00072.1 branched-chain amino acid transport system carrier protein [Lactobacillus nasalidis]GHW00777.1 branched-chain amino acid transport system carrier protein [Lactobacillus nasalidis]
MKEKLTHAESLTISSMLFGLFFGAGNLIFPAYLGEASGRNLWSALCGFLITGVGLPLLATAALGITRSEGLMELSGRVGRKYSYFFTCLLYLTIGPFFAIPRCFTVPFETGISALLPKGLPKSTGLFIFSLIFFAIMLFFSLRPGRIMDWIGKFLTPAFLAFFFFIMITALLHPLGSYQTSQPAGEYASAPLISGVLAGYNTMDALAGLAFGIIVISSIRTFGITKPEKVAAATLKTGLLTCLAMAVIYAITALVGAQSREALGLAANGGEALSEIASHYFPGLGAILFALMIFLACLKTAIGLVTACSETFVEMFPKSLSYNKWAILFSLLAFGIANVGLTTIISFSLPVLMLLYPLSISLILMALTSDLFAFKQADYQIMTAVTFLCALGDFFKALPAGMQVKAVTGFYGRVLPLYQDGLGWLLPVSAVFIILAAKALIGKKRS